MIMSMNKETIEIKKLQTYLIVYITGIVLKYCGSTFLFLASALNPNFF